MSYKTMRVQFGKPASSAQEALDAERELEKQIKESLGGKKRVSWNG